MANKTEESTETTVFNKKQLLSSKKYKNQSDVLNVVLSNDQNYTLNDVDKLIQNFKKMKG
jgi:hypothetical protein